MQRYLDRIIKRRPMAGLAAAMVVVCLIGAASLANMRLYATARDGVAHARAVRLALYRILTGALDAETGQRGYVITGNRAYRAPYDNAVAQIGGDLAALDRLTAEEPDQHDRVARLRSLADSKLAELDRTIALRESVGFDGARRTIETGAGKRDMDEIRAVVQQAEAVEYARVDQQIKREQVYYAMALVVIVGGSAALLLIIAGAGRIIRLHLAERERAEMALQKSERHLATTLHSIGDGVIVTDAVGRVTMLNAVAEALTGWSAAESRGYESKQVFRIVNQRTRAEVDSPIDRVIRDGRIVGLANHTILLTKDGREIPIDDSGAPVRDDAGNMAGIVLVFRDITERRRVEQEREVHLQAIEDLNMRLQRAMAETHHRVKNNLQIVSALIDVQAHEHGESIPKAEFIRLGRHVRSLAALHELLTQQTKAGDPDARVNASEILAKLLSLMQQTSPNHRITSDIEDATLSVKQATSIVLLLNELVSNAVKHGGAVVGVSLHAEGASLRLEVTDDGPGFPPSFDPETAANTGIELVQSLGRWDLQGDVVYCNREEGGACVVVTIPLPSEAVISSPSPRSMAAPYSS